MAVLPVEARSAPKRLASSARFSLCGNPLCRKGRNPLCAEKDEIRSVVGRGLSNRAAGRTGHSALDGHRRSDVRFSAI
jgi:hypothetical protein